VTDVLSQDLPERAPAPAIDAIEHLRGQPIRGAVGGAIRWGLSRLRSTLAFSFASYAASPCPGLSVKLCQELARLPGVEALLRTRAEDELTSKEFRDEDLRRPVARHQLRRTPGGHPRRQPLLVGVELPRDVVV
jgi:hypothetical protein